MEKTHRKGTNFKVAFLSAFKNLALDAVIEEQNPIILSETTVGRIVNDGKKQPRVRKHRLMSQPVYKVLKKCTRPFVFRIRRYFIDGVIQYLQQIRHEMLQELQATQQAQTQILSSIQNEIHNTISDIVTIQEHLKKIQLKTKQDIINIKNENFKIQNSLSNLLGDFENSTIELKSLINNTRADVAVIVQVLQQKKESNYNHVLNNVETISASLTTTILESQGQIQALQENLQNYYISNSKQVEKTNSDLFVALDRINDYTYRTAKRAAVHCGDGKILLRTDVGYVLCAESDYKLLASLLEGTELELGLRLFIQNYLTPGDIFIDIGANIGVLTLAAAAVLKGKGKIIAFEPFPQTAELLHDTVMLNGYSDVVEIHQAAVFNQDGNHALHLGSTSGHHSLFPFDSSDIKAASIKVPLVKLDTIVKETDTISLIKIDVEGAELEVIEGAQALIGKNKNLAIILEFSPNQLIRTGRTPEQWLAKLFQLDLTYKVINNDTGVLEEWTIEQLSQATTVNLFCAKQYAAVWGKIEQIQCAGLRK